MAGRLGDWLRRLLSANSTRLVLMVFGVQLALVMLAMGYVFVAAQEQIAQRDRGLVLEVRDDLLAAWRVGGTGEVAALIRARTAMGGPASALLLADAQGNAIAGNLPGLPAGVSLAGGWQEQQLDGPGPPPGPYLIVVTRLDRGHILLVGRGAAGSQALEAVLGRALATSFLVSMPAALLLALWLGRLANARLAGVARVAGDVAGGDLARRAPRDGSGDAFDRLAAAINAMLDRIEALVGELRIVTDGLAHDLRSPLTRMRARLDAAAAHAHDAETLSTLEDVGSEVDRLHDMLTTALQISRAQAGIGRDHFTLTDVGELLETIAEIYGPLAEEQGIALDAEAPPGLTALLHQPLLQQALGNLVDNALRHARGATHVHLSAQLVPGAVELAVADDGPGIPEAQRALALSRFGRLDPARSDGGMGLGLSLVQAVAGLHDGHLTLADNRPGLKLVISLPQPDHGDEGSTRLPHRP